jgi:hypothetical protein
VDRYETLRLYEVGGRASVNPRKLSRALRGFEPLSADMERRVRAVLEEEAALEKRILGEERGCA